MRKGQNWESAYLAYYTCIYKRFMPPSRTAILNLRVDPALKEVLLIAADREHRSVANMPVLMPPPSVI